MNKTFKPVLKEDGSILAGGMKVAQLRGRELVWEDDYHPRANARGTPDVPVDVQDLLDLLIEAFSS